MCAVMGVRDGWIPGGGDAYTENGRVSRSWQVKNSEKVVFYSERANFQRKYKQIGLVLNEGI